MYSEPNLHSRNLKLISLLFIFYWLFELTPVDNSIRLLVINYEIKHPQALKWVAHILLFYFAWRFYLSSKRRIRTGFRSSASRGSFQNRESAFYKLLKKRATSHYELNHRASFQKEREEIASKHNSPSFNNETYRISPLDLKYENNNFCMTYQVQYEGPRLPGNDFRNFSISYKWHQWLWYKTWALIKFISEKEESPDYLFPWVLFLLAIATSALSHFGIKVQDIL